MDEANAAEYWSLLGLHPGSEDATDSQIGLWVKLSVGGGPKAGLPSCFQWFTTEFGDSPFLSVIRAYMYVFSWIGTYCSMKRPKVSKSANGCWSLKEVHFIFMTPGSLSTSSCIVMGLDRCYCNCTAWR